MVLIRWMESWIRNIVMRRVGMVVASRDSGLLFLLFICGCSLTESKLFVDVCSGHAGKISCCGMTHDDPRA